MPSRGGIFTVALLAGACLTLAFPEPDLFPIAWIAIAPLIVFCRGTRVRRGAALGLLFGLAFFGTLLYWISIVGWVAWGLLVLLQASFLALFASGVVLVSRLGSAWVRVPFVAAIWTALELLRSIIPVVGFTWGELAQSQHDAPWMLRPAALGGAWAVAFIVCGVNALLAEAWLQRGTMKTSASALAAAAVVLAVPVILPSPERGSGAAARVAIVQGNVPVEIPESGAAREQAILASHVELTSGLNDEKVDLVVWPESAVGIDVDRDPQALLQIVNAARAADSPVIAGGNLDLADERYLVMAFHIDPVGGLVDRYQKTHLVPFGEYVPGRRFLQWIPMLAQVPRDAVAGSAGRVFSPEGLPGPVAPVISFEGDFGSLVRGRIAAGGRLLIVATNTSTWRHSWASAQHVAMSQVRAAETAVWVVHAALSGISALIAPDGTVIDQTPLWKATTLVGDVRFPEGASLYVRTGDWVGWGSVALALLGLWLGARRDRVPVEEAA